MALDFSLTSSLQNRLSLSIRQSLHILQMPQEELSLWLEEELIKNPLLKALPPPSFHSSIPIDQIEVKPSLHEHLLQQIYEAIPCEKKRAVAIELLAYLDEKGYLMEVPKELEISSLLPILQSLHPPGIFARNLQECLLLQLPKESIAYQLIRDFFLELQEKKLQKIQKALNLTSLKPILATLKKLTTRPAASFAPSYSQPIITDLKITKRENLWAIEIKEDYLPTIYLEELPKELKLSKEEKKIISSWKKSGKELLFAIEKRKELLQKITAFFVKKQAAYLEGKEGLAPLSLEDLKQEFSLSLSTLSRALSQKYVETPKGILPLKAFLSSSITQSEGQKILLELIKKENPKKPLSDQELMEMLQKKGIPIARRTVTKYRKKLKIPSASLRKD